MTTKTTVPTIHRTHSPGAAALVLAALLASFSILAAAPAAACSVPVFRYALERWPADRYRAVLYHDGPLSPEQTALVERLSETPEGAGPPNIVVRPTDLAEGAEDTPEPLVELWDAEREAGAEPPWLVIAYPPGQTALQVVWSGPLTAENIDPIIDSPARRAIRQGILDGESAVWVFLESGDAKADDDAFNRIRKDLDYAVENLELPEIALEDFSVLSGEEETRLPIRLSFDAVRVSPDDPAETFLRRMLMRTEPDLMTEYADQPMAFPVYGRGRALYALVGAGITTRNILLAGVYITGPCSCEVKAQNPGVDLLIAADWTAGLGPSAIPDAGSHFIQHLARGKGEAAAPPALAPRVDNDAASTQTEAATPVSRTGPGRALIATLVTGVLLVLLAGAALLFIRRGDS